MHGVQEPGRHGRRPRIGRARLVASAVVLAAALVGAGTAWPHDVVPAARSMLSAAETRPAEATDNVRAVVASATSQIGTAQAALDASRGRTLDDAAQLELASAILRWQHKVSTVISAYPSADPALPAASVALLRSLGQGTSAAAASRVSGDVHELSLAGAALKTPEDALSSAVLAWHAEQTRLAALEASASYTQVVWTSGWQPQIDACKGAVDLTAHYGIRTIAEHDTCGGSSFPTTPGTIVRITGVDAGFYRVVGVVAYLDGHTSTRYDLPRGYDLLFQTCVNGYSDMSFTALTRIGG